MPYCRECGTELEGETCPKCGNPYPAGQATPGPRLATWWQGLTAGEKGGLGCLVAALLFAAVSLAGNPMRTEPSPRDDAYPAVQQAASEPPKPSPVQEWTDETGIPIGRRQQIFEAVVRAERRAFAEAEHRYPTEIPDGASRETVDRLATNAKPNSRMAAHLRDRYLGQVRRKYRITEEQEGWIRAEGVRRGWNVSAQSAAEEPTP